METSRTISDSVMFAVRRTSSRNAGIGAIIASTIASTARGTDSSLQGSLRRSMKKVAESPLIWGLRALGGAPRRGGPSDCTGGGLRSIAGMLLVAINRESGNHSLMVAARFRETLHPDSFPFMI